jgi:hypothetical protein
MLLTKANMNGAIALVEGPSVNNSPVFPDAIRKRVLNSTVKLNATGKDKVSNFIGSGVIFDLDSTYVWVLTAAHNVGVWAKPEDPTTNWPQYASQFGAAIKIGYGGSVDMKFNLGVPIYSAKEKNTVDEPPLQNLCGNQAGCLYDVLIIKSSDPGLRTWAQQFVFGGQAISAINAQVQKEYAAIRDRPDTFLDSKSYYFVQLGYGKVMDDRTGAKIVKNQVVKGQKLVRLCESGMSMAAGNLQYRLTNPSIKQSCTMYDLSADTGQAPAYNVYVNAISTAGRVSSTTAEGDSGGPLYAVDKAFNTAYLLGVTSGADMLPQPSATLKVFRNVISASTAPYFASQY